MEFPLDAAVEVDAVGTVWSGGCAFREVDDAGAKFINGFVSAPLKFGMLGIPCDIATALVETLDRLFLALACRGAAKPRTSFSSELKFQDRINVVSRSHKRRWCINYIVIDPYRNEILELL